LGYIVVYVEVLLMSSNAAIPTLPPPQQLKLDNGLTLIHQPTAGTGVVAIDVWIKAGSIVEPDQWSGMAHFLEHMIFKGSDRVLPGMFDQAIESHGGMANAATGYDYAHYYMVMAQQHFASTLPYLAEILVHATIPADTFDAERQVVLEEMRKAWDEPDYLAYQRVGEQIYPPHGYGRPILGTPESLATLTPELMRQFHQSFYQPENMTIVVVGDVDQATTIDLIQTHFTDFAPAIATPIYQPAAATPIGQQQRQELHLPQVEEARLMLNWLTPGWDQVDRQAGLRLGYGLDLLSLVLASGRTSRLVQELVETKGLVYGIDANFSLQRDSGVLSLTAWLEETELATVEAILHDRIAELLAEPISDIELKRYQRFLCNEAAYSSELPEQLASLYGYYAMVGDLGAIADYPHQIASITATELQSIAQTYLDFDQCAVTIVHCGD
jgi:zinc protease